MWGGAFKTKTSALSSLMDSSFPLMSSMERLEELDYCNKKFHHLIACYSEILIGEQAVDAVLTFSSMLRGLIFMVPIKMILSHRYFDRL